MPMYKYVCPNCEYETVLLQSIQNPFVPLCPFCKQLMRKHVGAVTVVFKGNGYYSTSAKSDKQDDDSLV